MIVDSMTYKEIISEFQYDWNQFIYDKLTNCFGMANTYRRYMLKYMKDDPVFFTPIEFESKRGNTYIVRFSCKGKADYKKNGLIVTLYMYYRIHGRIYAVLSTGGNRDTFIFYTPHLFDRYRERELKDLSLNKLHVVNEFFKSNSTANFMSLDNPKYVNSLYGVSKSGILLGKKITDSLYEIKTYITFDMLKGTQINDKNNLMADLITYIESKQIL